MKLSNTTAFYHSYHHVLLTCLIGQNPEETDFLSQLATDNVLIEHTRFLNTNKASAGISWTVVLTSCTGLY